MNTNESVSASAVTWCALPQCTSCVGHQ
jgi:hypothetical protein